VLATCSGLAAATVLAGCGADPNGFNDADVRFAADMTQHHAQTVRLVNLPLRHRVPTADGMWTDAARTRLFSELQVLERLLRSWGEKVPETGLDHSDEGKHITFDAAIPGVLTGQEMQALEQAPDRAFTRVWLQQLIRHERAAVRMAADEVADGQNAKAVALARRDKAAHAALVAKLEQLARS
jgi:uncharacterized protein (DUF305 family)